jgi:hypothetical protein
MTKTVRISFFILVVVITILLLGYGIAGFHSRYLADDYCYDAQFIKKGFWEGQIDSYFSPMPYSSNRYSLTFFSGIMWAIGGVVTMPFFPLFYMIVWGCSIYYAIMKIGKYFSINAPKLFYLLVTLTILLFTIVLAPNRYQILFWRSGMLPYLIPLIFSTYIIGRFFFYLERDKLGSWGAIELGLLAFISAGFSETVFAFQMGVCLILIFIMVISKNKKGRNAALAIFSGLCLGALLLSINPTNSLRQNPFPDPPSIPFVILYSILYAKDFFFYSVRGAWIPFIVIITLGFIIGWHFFKSIGITQKNIVKMILLSLTSLFLLLVCIMAPTLWAMSAYPEQRGLLSGSYIIVIFLFEVGLFLGVFGSKALNGRVTSLVESTLSVLAILFIFLYLIRMVPSQLSMISQYQKRAKLWDTRNSEILSRIDRGEKNLVVPGIDSIAQIIELQKEPGFWVNNCAAVYYQIDSIQTTE